MGYTVIMMKKQNNRLTARERRKENKMKIRIENGTEVMVNRITDYIANDGEQYSLAWDDAHGIAYRIVGRDASGAIWARDDN